MKTVEKYGMFEMAVNAGENAGIVSGNAVFQSGSMVKEVPAFLNRAGEYIVRFMPEKEGVWNYRIMIGSTENAGEFLCTSNTGNNHGPVHTAGYHFCYADQTRYIPVGTTCYAWTNQTKELQDETIETLRNAPFNKVRMCVFPKSMPYNHNDPEHYPFFKKQDGSWDIENPDPEFWENMDKRISQKMEAGIEADLILFHPYDRWGFAELTQEESLIYLTYCIARFGAFRNIWWSLANEYEVLYAKSMEDWDVYGETLKKKDVFSHLISIHNIIAPYPKREWMTHCSIQSGDINRIIFWKKEYELPVMIDECGYEGNIQYNWGNLTAFEMVHRFWWTICRDGFCTHGETFHRDDEVLWWAKGGKLYGESAERIKFLKEVLYSLPGDWRATEAAAGNPNLEGKDEAAVRQEMRFQEMLKDAPETGRETFIENISPMAIEGDTYRLEYLGRCHPFQTELYLPEDGNYRVEIIDIWEMTRKTVLENVSGYNRVRLPEKEGIALLAMRIFL